MRKSTLKLGLQPILSSTISTIGMTRKEKPSQTWPTRSLSWSTSSLLFTLGLQLLATLSTKVKHGLTPAEPPMSINCLTTSSWDCLWRFLLSQAAAKIMVSVASSTSLTFALITVEIWSAVGFVWWQNRSGIQQTTSDLHERPDKPWSLCSKTC